MSGNKKIWEPELVSPEVLAAARRLRVNMTDAEKMLWARLRGKQLNGFRFRKQHPVDRFVLDFYCAEVKLAVELDGSQHCTDEGKERDRERTEHLESKGIQVLRFWNHDVLTNIEGTIERILKHLDTH